MNHHRWSKIGLTVGFLALTGAVLLARRSPPTGYELSVYTATPTVVWAGLGVALIFGVIAALVDENAGRVSDAGLFLAGAAVFAVMTMPLLRGYYYYGAGDALSHLGWTRELASGSLAPVNLLYPGIHTTAVFIEGVTGLTLRTALMLVVLGCYSLVFLLFVPLCVRLLDGTRLGLTIGVLTALLLTPINGIATHASAHPSTQGILFFPFLLYLVLRYSVRTDRGADTLAAVEQTEIGNRATAMGILLALASTAVVLIHPQQALNVLVFFGTVAVVQALYRFRTTDHPITTHRPLYAQTGLLVGAFLLWTPRFQRVQEAVTGTVMSVLLRGPTAGTVVASKAFSLSVVGGSLYGVFLKLFLPALVLSLLAAGLIVALATGRLADERSDATALLLYLTAALVPLFGVFLLLLAAASGDMYFRYHAFIMVLVTILGAVALARVVRAVEPGGTRTGVRFALVAIFLLLLPLGAAAYHSSPYVYQPTPHVTESQMEGYAGAFEHRQAGTPFIGIRGGPRRYVDAAYGTQYATDELAFPGYEKGINGSDFRQRDYLQQFEQDHYMVVTDAVYDREVRLYNGFRYDAGGFRELETTPGVNRIRANDEVQQYLINGTGR